MRYAQLRAFHFVAVTGGFSRAAEAMNLTQPAVSDQVRKLELAYDTKLFDRHRKQVVLTQRGAALLEITHRMFEIEAQALELLTESREVATGTLRIIADSAHHITEALSRFRARFPKVKIEMRTGNSSDVLAALQSYEADIGVLGNMSADSDFVEVRLSSSPIVAFAAKGIASNLRPKATLEDISAYDLILREQGSKTRQKLEEAAARQAIDLIAIIEAEGREAVHEIVASGVGIGFVSDAEYGQDARLHKFHIDGPAIPMVESVACLARRKEVRLIAAFMRIAAQQSGQV